MRCVRAKMKAREMVGGARGSGTAHPINLRVFGCDDIFFGVFFGCGCVVMPWDVP
jgi:hypothetical protein